MRSPARAALALLPLCGACASHDPAARWGAPAAPADKLEVIAAAAGHPDDPDAAALLVEQLDSDDPAVRLAAITALRRATGQHLGYQPEAAPAEREPAVLRWVAYITRLRAGATPEEPQQDG